MSSKSFKERLIGPNAVLPLSAGECQDEVQQAAAPEQAAALELTAVDKEPVQGWAPLVPGENGLRVPAPELSLPTACAGGRRRSSSVAFSVPVSPLVRPLSFDEDNGSRQDKQHLQLSLFRGSVSKSFSAMKSFAELITADDPTVMDKWHQRSESMGSASNGGALPYSDSLGASQRSFLRETLSMNAKPTRLILKNYGQALLYSMFTALVIVPLVYGLSRLPWHVANPPGVQPVFTLNTKTFQLSLILQCVFPLSLYALILYACIKCSWKIPRILLIYTSVSICVAVSVAILFWWFDVPFWYYSGDFIYIALSYVPGMCIVGWYLEDDESATLKERAQDLLLVAALETMVASAALIYCMYLMPLFYMLSAWGQLAWMMVLHPVYFEITTAFILRVVLRRNAVKGRSNVLWFLSIVHAVVHSVSIASILTSSIDQFGVTILTQVLCSASKLVWRSTTNLRDIWAERLLRWDFKFAYPQEESLVQNRLVAVGIQTEMILENASNILAPWMIWCTWHVPLFMAVAPELLVQGGTYPVYYVLGLITALVAVTAVFDIAFMFLNYHGFQELPVIQTWREIRKAGFWYFGFLTYALTFMGFMFLFITMIIVPRWTFCHSNNYCDCRLPTLQGICDGQYISTWGGNII